MHLQLLEAPVHDEEVRGGSVLGGSHLVLVPGVDQLDFHRVRELTGRLDLTPGEGITSQTIKFDKTKKKSQNWINPLAW